MGNIYTCKRLRMYEWLTRRGWKPIRTIPDTDNASYINWIYEATKEFKQDVKLYFELLKMKKHNLLP